MKKEFTTKELKEIVGNKSFSWGVLHVQGHSGGILVGVKEDLLELENCEIF